MSFSNDDAIATKDSHELSTEVKIRLARGLDRTGTIALSRGIYDGHDYLPLVYDKCLGDSRCKMYVAEKEGTLVGLVSLGTIDGGKTILCQGVRVAMECRGQGIASMLIKEALARSKQDNPQLECVRAFVAQDYTPSITLMKKMGLQQERQLLYCLTCKVEQRKSHSLNQHLKEENDLNSIDLFPYSFAQVKSIILANTAVIKALFPNGLATIGGSTYEVGIKSNANDMFQEGDRMFGDVNCDLNEADEDKLPRSFSTGRRSNRVIIPHWQCSIHTQDPMAFRAHMKYQLLAGLEEIQGDFVFHPYHSRSLFQECHQLLEDELGLEPLENYPGPQYVVMEGNFSVVLGEGGKVKLK